jgi:hypothetical protein
MAELEFWVCFTDTLDPARVVDPIGERFLSAGVRRVFTGRNAEQKAKDLARTMNSWPDKAEEPNVWMPSNIRASVKEFWGA